MVKTTDWNIFKLLSFDDADYLFVCLHKPTLSTTTSAIDLVNTMKPAGLNHLIHLHMGCPGLRSTESLLNGKSVVGLPANVIIPNTFFCPICLKEKQPSLSKHLTRESPFKVVGQMLHMDFGFYGKQSCQGFKCFLVVTEAMISSNHCWTFCQQSKTTPVKLVLWNMQHVHIRTGQQVQHICMDGELFANDKLKMQLSLSTAHCC